MPGKCSAPLFLSHLKFSVSRQEKAVFHLHIIQLISHFPLGYVCFEHNVNAAPVIDFFVSLGVGGSAASIYMPLVPAGRRLTGRRMTVTLY